MSLPILYQSTYGRLQTRYHWPVVFLGVVGIIGIPMGIFANEGWRLGVRPMEPWAATVIIEIFSVGALLLAAAAVAASQMRRRSPQRVALTVSNLIVPKGWLSTRELTLPLAELELRVFNAGFVKQLQIKHRRKKILLTSALFPSDAEFDRFVQHLPVMNEE